MTMSGLATYTLSCIGTDTEIPFCSRKLPGRIRGRKTVRHVPGTCKENTTFITTSRIDSLMSLVKAARQQI